MTISANFPNVQPSLLLDFANAKQLPPQVTFTRATTAAYYDGSTTAKAEQNFVLYSQTFSNANWAANSATKTSTTATDPAGGSTALTLTKTGTSDYSLRQTGIAPSANKTYTVSCYLKGTAGDTVNLYMDNGVDQTVVSQSVTLTASWVRYTGTGTFNSTSANVTCGVNFGSGTTATSVDVAFFQVEERSSATAYTATTTQAITNYIPVLLTAGGGQPRFDHNPTTSESLGLLIEEQRTNRITYSEDFSQWSGNGVVVSTNQLVGPGGTLTADLMVGDGNNSPHTITSFDTTSSTGKTASVYVKTRDCQYFQIWFDGDASPRANFDLVAGTVTDTGGGVTATITNVGNGWYRCACGTSSTAATTPRFALISSATSGRNQSWTTSTGVYLWGGQCEAGTFATSYIPTTSASTTRAQDTVLMTGSNFSSWHNPAEGVLYAEWRPYTLTPSVANGVFSLNNGGDNNVVQIFGSLVSGRTTFEIYSAGVSYVSASVSSVLTTTNFAKIAASYETNNAIQATDGQLSSADTSVSLLSGINRADIGTINGGNYVGNGHYKKVAYYPQAVTSAQLQALTS